MNKINLLLTIVTSFLISPIFAQISESGSKNNTLSEYRSLSGTPGCIKGSIYTDPSMSSEERTKDLISRMTFEKKVLLTDGWNTSLRLWK